MICLIVCQQVTLLYMLLRFQMGKVEEEEKIFAQSGGTYSKDSNLVVQLEKFLKDKISI